MQSPGPPKSIDTGLERLWLKVCAARGTPAPDPGQRGRFVHDLEPEARRALESVLTLAARGREQPGDLSLLSWAAACTRPSLLSQLKSQGLAFTSVSLFACGMKLREAGWDMQQRLAQLASHPEDVDTLRAWLPALPGEPVEQPLQALAAPERPEDAAVDETLFPWSDDDRDDGHAPGWEGEPTDTMDESPIASNPSSVRGAWLVSFFRS